MQKQLAQLALIGCLITVAGCTATPPVIFDLESDKAQIQYDGSSDPAAISASCGGCVCYP